MIQTKFIGFMSNYILSMKLYPYIGDDTLLCYTWNQDVSDFSRLRINPTENAGIKKYITCV